MKYIIGLDVGIGSVGWAVVRNEENCKRIEDFGVRIFDSGEDLKKQKRESQIRREYRGTRRQIRRRRQRKERLKNFLDSILLLHPTIQMLPLNHNLRFENLMKVHHILQTNQRFLASYTFFPFILSCDII